MKYAKITYSTCLWFCTKVACFNLLFFGSIIFFLGLISYFIYIYFKKDKKFM